MARQCYAVWREQVRRDFLPRCGLPAVLACELCLVDVGGVKSGPGQMALSGFEHMKCFELAWMFAGLINRRWVLSCHPFFVVCAKGIVAEVATLESAERFLSGRGFGGGCIYRHNGRDWDKLEKNPWAIDRIELGEPTSYGEDR